MLLRWKNKFIIISIAKIVLKSFHFLRFHLSVRHHIFTLIEYEYKPQCRFTMLNVKFGRREDNANCSI